MKTSLAASLVLFALAGSALADVQQETRNMCVVAVLHCDYPPVSFVDKTTGKPSGFIVDAMESIGRRAGLQVNYICRSSWPAMIHAIEQNEADLGALMKSAEREKKLAFTSPVEISYLSFFARSNSSIVREGVPAGYRVGVINGSMSQEQLKKRRDLHLAPMGDYQAGIFSLLAGEIDLFAGEEGMVLKRARETGLDDRIRKVGASFLERERAIAVRKNNAALLNRLNRSLHGFIESPEYQLIYLKWYGAPVSFWTMQKVLWGGGGFLFLAVCGMAVWRYRSIASVNRELIRNIAERRNIERLLEQSEAFNTSILETVDEGFIVIDRDYRIVSANNAYLCQLKLPLDKVLGRSCYEISHGSSRPCYEAGEDCATQRTFRTGKPDTAVHRHKDIKGGMVIVEIKTFPIRDESGKVISVIEVVNNITEKVNLEAQVCHSKKLEAVGQLAGGVAHDFNNILTAIIGYARLAQLKMASDGPVWHDLQQIVNSADRAANLTRGLLAFSRKQMIDPRRVNLNDIVKNIEKLILRLIGDDIVPRFFYADKDIVCLADSGQIEQILMNLATNARDAMPDGGELVIRTECVDLDDEFIKTHVYVKKGRYALLSVKDPGLGMDEKTRENIFEPFFTTKELGRGTGLGLSIVYGIVKQHNGYIECESEQGKGTEFRIYLPLIQGETQKAAPAAGHASTGGSETILVAEDDQTVRALIKEVLTLHGYMVIEAANGDEALARFREQRDAVQLLLLDVLMPGKGGKEVYDEIRGKGGKVKALFISGYTADVISKKGVLDEGINFISKPVSPAELLKKIRELLDREP